MFSVQLAVRSKKTQDASLSECKPDQGEFQRNKCVDAPKLYLPVSLALTLT